MYEKCAYFFSGKDIYIVEIVQKNFLFDEKEFHNKKKYNESET